MKHIAIVSGKNRASGGIESIIELLSAGEEYQFHRFFYDTESYDSVKKVGSRQRPVYLHAIKEEEERINTLQEEDAAEKISESMKKNIMNLRKRFGKVLDKQRIDLIHIHSPNMTPAGFLAKTAQQNGIPIVTTFHYAKMRGSKRKKLAIQQSCNYSDRIICVSTAGKEVLVSTFGNEDKTEIIYNGIVLDRFSLQPRTYDPTQPLRMLYPAPICKEKGHLDLLEIIEKVHKHTDNFYITLRGNHKNNPIHKALFRKKRNDKGLMDHFLIRNPLDYSKMPREYEAHDIVIFPSQEEGLGLISLEGQASGLPILSSDVGGIVETLEPGVSSLISPYVPKKDDKEGFERYIEIYAQNILQIMQEPFLYRTLSENAVDFIKNARHFHQEYMIEKHRELYDTLIS
jgi:L-malate glycosyltransferase